MFRRLSIHDHERCLKLLKTRSAENLLIIGDIEAYGYDQEFQKLWGEFNDREELIAILLKYEGNYIPFAIESFNAQEFADIMSRDPDFVMMSGLKEITEEIEPYIDLPLKQKRQTYYAKCSELKIDTRAIDFSMVQQARPSDVGAIVEFVNSIPEFRQSPTSVDTKYRELIDGHSRSFFIIEDGQIVSTASSAAENSMSAMVVAVATLEEYKKKGYATKCMLKLCSELFFEGKELCLYYDNHEAGAIYKRIGFKDIGFWMMYSYL